MDVSYMLLIKALIFTNLCFYWADAHGFQNSGLCGNSACSVPIGEGVTLQNYFPDAPEKLGFEPNENVVIYSRGCGKRSDYLGVVIKERRGYVPEMFVKETKSLISKNNLVPAEVFLGNTDTALIGASSPTESPSQWPSDSEHFYSEKEAQTPQFQHQDLSSSFPPSRLVPPNPRPSNQLNVESSISDQGDPRSEWDHSNWVHRSSEPPSLHQSGSFSHQQGSSFDTSYQDASHMHFSSSFGSQDVFHPSREDHFYSNEFDPSSSYQVNQAAPELHGSQNVFGGDFSSSYDVNQASPEHYSSHNQHLSSSYDANQASAGHYSSSNFFGREFPSTQDVYQASPDYNSPQNGDYYKDFSSVDPTSHNTGPQSVVDHSRVEFVTPDGRPVEQNEDLMRTLRMLEEQGYDLDDHVYEEDEGTQGGFAEQVEASFAPEQRKAQSRSFDSLTLNEEDEDEIEIEEEEMKVEDLTTPITAEKESSEPSETLNLKTEILTSKPVQSSSDHEYLNLKSDIASSIPVSSNSQGESMTSKTDISHFGSKVSISSRAVLSNSQVEIPTFKTQIPNSDIDVPNSDKEITRPVVSSPHFEALTSKTQIPNSDLDIPNSDKEITRPVVSSPHFEALTSKAQIPNSDKEITRPVVSSPHLKVLTSKTEIPRLEPDTQSSKEEILNSGAEILSSRFEDIEETLPFASETEALLLTRETKILNSVSSLFSTSETSEENNVPQSSLNTPDSPTSSESHVKESLSENSFESMGQTPRAEQNSSDLKEGDSSDFFQSRHLKEDYDQNQESEESPEGGFDFFGTLDNGLEAIRAFVEVLISWLPEPLHSLVLRVGEEGLSPRVPVFTLISSLPCLSLILALCYIKEKSKEKKLTALLALSEKNLYELAAQKNILEEKIEKTSEELKSSSTTLDSERTSYENEVESLKERIKKATSELDQSREDIQALKKQEEEYARLAEDYKKTQQELSEQKGRVLELEELSSNLNSEVAQKDDELESLQKEQLQLLKASKDSEEQLNQLQQNCNQLLKEAEVWNLRVQELTSQLTEVSSEKEEAQSLLATKEQDIQSLTHLVETLKSFEEVSDRDETKPKDEVLKELLNATSLLIKLENQEEENKSLSEKLMAEKNKMIEKEVEVLEVRSECDKLKLSYNQALQDRTEAQTKLDVLTNYFKDKEIQMQREIGAQEAVREKREKDADSAERRIVLIEQENSSYKYQVASMKQEMEETERNLKSQIATQEKKAHENWIAARAAERRLEDMKQEMSILKQRLTLLEQEATAAREEVLRPVPKRLGEEELPPMFPPPMMLPLDRPLPPHLLPPLDGPHFRPPWHLDAPPDFRGRDTPPRHSSPLMRDATPPPHEFQEGPPRPPFFPPIPRFPPPPMWGHRKPEDPLNHSSNRSHHSSDSWHQSNSRG